MKSILRLLSISAILASTNVLVGQDAPLILTAAEQTVADNRAATVAAVVANVRLASVSEKEAFIQAAINSDPGIAGLLIDALIFAFPVEASTMTGFVVQSVLTAPSLSTNTILKSSILTEVAQAAVEAAVQIPASTVPNVVNAVNAVKSELAAVTATFPDVAPFTTPITELPTINTDPNPNPTPVAGEDGTVTDTTTETQIIVSDDTP